MSADGGDTWFSISDGLNKDIDTIVFDPLKPLVYVSGQGPGLCRIAVSELLKGDPGAK